MEAIAGLAGPVVGGLLGGASGGGSTSATQTASKEPWAPAVPWITSNLQAGQDLQKYYQQTPFNAIQQGAYANLLTGNDYVNSMIPGLLSQMSQSQGFDRSNPRARPQTYQFPAMPQSPSVTTPMQPMAGLLGAPASGGMNVSQNPYMNGSIQAQAPAPAPAAAAPQTFDIRTEQGMRDWINSTMNTVPMGGGY